MNEMVVVEKNRDLVYSGFRFQRTGLSPIGKPTFEQWEQCGKFIGRVEQAVQFWLGDWLNYGESVWGEKYSQALEDTSYTYGTLANAAYVARKIDFSSRNENLSFAHHYAIAKLTPEEQQKFLVMAEEYAMSVRELRREIQKHRREELAEPESEDTLDTVYTDDYGAAVCPKCGEKFYVK